MNVERVMPVCPHCNWPRCNWPLTALEKWKAFRHRLLWVAVINYNLGKEFPRCTTVTFCRTQLTYVLKLIIE